MAAEQPKPKASEAAAETAKTSAPSAGKAGWRRFVAKRWFIVLVVALATVPIAAFACFRPQPLPPPPVPPTEIALGEFQFTGGKDQDCCLAEARFSLAITLLSQVDGTAREMLADRRLRVQQAVEQLLRSAHSADFDDPSLAELKRQMREQIDQTLGMRAVGEVIVTDLKVRPSDRPAQPVADLASPGR